MQARGGGERKKIQISHTIRKNEKQVFVGTEETKVRLGVEI